MASRCFLLLLLLGTGWLRAEDEITLSPHKTFEIIQHDQNGWQQTLRFTKEPTRSIILEANIPWPAVYAVSPDEHWILRVQKSGSGDNISFLYHLDEHGQLWRKEEQVGQLGFAYLATQSDMPRELYHTGVEFGSWDLKNGLLRFTIHGSDANESGRGVERALTYRLRDGVIAAP